MTPQPGSQSNARYLDARVTTASQPQLQLMLLDGALRLGRQVKQLWIAETPGGEAMKLLARVLDIVEELVRGVSGGSTEASKRLEEEYAFVFRQLAAAQINGDAAALESALRLLAYHRDTWKLACEKLETAETAAVTEPALTPPTPAPHFDSRRSGVAAPFAAPLRGGPRLSLEA